MIFYKRINDKRLRVIFYLLIINFINDIYGLYTVAHNINNSIAYNIYVLIETISLYYFFNKILFNITVKRIIFISGGLFIFFWLYQFLKLGHQKFLDFCMTLENITILAFSIYFYYEQIFTFSSAYIYKSSTFWVVSAYLIFVAGIFFLYLYLPSLDKGEEQKLYVLNYIFVIIRTTLLSVAMFMKNNNSGKEKFNLTQSRPY